MARHPDLTGTFKVGPAVKTIGAYAFYKPLNTSFLQANLTSLDLSNATSLVSIGDSAFLFTDLGGTLVLPATVTTIGRSAFANTELTGTLKVGAAVKTIGTGAFLNVKLAGLDLSEATALISIGDGAFRCPFICGATEGLITGTIVTPFKVPKYTADHYDFRYDGSYGPMDRTFPPGVSIVSSMAS